MPGRLLSGTRLWSGSGKSADFPRHPAPGAVGRRSTCQGGNPRRPARPTSAAKAENRQIFQDSGKYFLEHHFPQSVPVTRGQGQSPALEGGAHANFRVTPPLPRGGRFRKSGRLEPALSPDNQALAVFLLKGTRDGSAGDATAEPFREGKATSPPLRQAAFLTPRASDVP